ncbi:MAG: YeeE/YedE thiosulfate transporter family protein, partial [Candidatus Caldatribacteriota bacterium]
MFKRVHSQKKLQLFFGFVMGILFGFLLQKGGVAKYDVIIGQLLLKDFTVIKIMLTAIVVGMPGIYLMKDLGLIELHPKPGSIGMTMIGGIIFGIG